MFLNAKLMHSDKFFFQSKHCEMYCMQGKDCMSSYRKVRPSGLLFGNAIQGYLYPVARDVYTTTTQRVPNATSDVCTTTTQRVPNATSDVCTTTTQRVPNATSDVCTTTTQRVPNATSDVCTTTTQRVPNATSDVCITPTQRVPNVWNTLGSR